MKCRTRCGISIYKQDGREVAGLVRWVGEFCINQTQLFMNRIGWMLLWCAALVSCTESDTTLDSPWGIAYSDAASIRVASGIITDTQGEVQNNRAVVSAYVLEAGAPQYQVTLTLDNGDVLTMMIRRQDAGVAFVYPGDATSNSLLSVKVNQEDVSLASSTLTVQPKTGSNRFTLVLDLYVTGGRRLSGTVSNVPLIKALVTK